MLEEWYVKDLNVVSKTTFNFLHLLVWFLVLQLAVALMAKCHLHEDKREAIINNLYDMKNVELNMKSWALLLAHIDESPHQTGPGKKGAPPVLAHIAPSPRLLSRGA